MICRKVGLRVRHILMWRGVRISLDEVTRRLNRRRRTGRAPRSMHGVIFSYYERGYISAGGARGSL